MNWVIEWADAKGKKGKSPTLKQDYQVHDVVLLQGPCGHHSQHNPDSHDGHDNQAGENHRRILLWSGGGGKKKE